MTDPRILRARFPALSQTDEGLTRIYFDNPAGTQVPQEVIDAISDYFIQHNANSHGAFRTSQSTDALLDDAHQAMADLLNAPSPREIVFGANMTTLTFALSRALAHQVRPGQEIVLTRLDHDANVSPWLRMAEDTGATVRWIDFDPADCTLRLEDLDRVIHDRTFLVAVGYASNLVGTINPVQTLIAKAHAVGALAFIDSVHYVPHGPVDVQALGADFLACSPYKFFGPHQGVLWGRSELLEELPAYRVRPAGAGLPGKFETGTQNHECMAGTVAALDYLAGIGRQFGTKQSFPQFSGRRLHLRQALTFLQSFETTLSHRLLEGLQTVKGLKVWGITDPNRLPERVPTVAFTIDGHSPRAIARHLAARNIFAWDGHSYALEVVRRLGLEDSGGVLRVGAVHYNTPAEIRTLVEALTQLPS